MPIVPNTIRVQIQTQSTCDGRCTFCPNAAVLKSGKLPQGRMTPELFHRIVDELAPLQPRRISPYLMNEPLLDDRLPDFVRYVSERVPETTTLVTSNGTHLSREMGEALIDAGLRRLKISLQSLVPETNRALMGDAVDSERVAANVVAFKRLMKEKRAKAPDLRVSMVVTKLNENELARTRRFWRRHGIRLVTSALENRGGNVDAASLNPHGMAAFRQGCPRPSRELCILWNGDVVLCCVDWWRTVIVGNAGEQSIEDIWAGPALETIRRRLRENDADLLPKICRDCEQSASPDYHRSILRRRIDRWLGRRS